MWRVTNVPARYYYYEGCYWTPMAPYYDYLASGGHWSIFRPIASKRWANAGYARITPRCHSRSAVVNDKACRSVSLYVHISTPDMTSLATLSWQLWSLKKLSKSHLRRLQIEFWIFQERFEQGSRHFAGLSWTIGPTNLPDMTLPAVSNRLQNAIKYCTKVHKTDPAAQRVIIWPLFNL